MEKYENLGMLGEGSYGMVMKCRHKETKQIVAIKKFLETEDDKVVRKIALREVKMLKQVRHENLINLLEVFRRKRRLYLVFEFVDHTALDELERFPNGADENYVKKIMWQVLKGVEFCHVHNIIHRDVKPENILISKRGVVKLCDFGFARTIAPPGEIYTDYVATRWYRAPELLVGDTSYGRAVDIWAVGCLFSEMLTGEPLFPGESDIDQLHLITKCFGNIIGHHREVFRRNPLFIGMRLPEARELESLERRYPQLSPSAMDIVKWALRLDPSDRPSCSQLVRHELFTRNGWMQKFTTDLRLTIEKEFAENPLLKSLGITIYGSVYEAKQREIAEKKVQMEVAEVTSEIRSSHESKTLDTESRVRRKEKKKKIKKDVLLTREKALRGLSTEGPGKAVLTDVPTKLPPTTSQTSLTASQPQLLSPHLATPQRQLPPTPTPSSPQTFELLPPVQRIVPQMEVIPSNLTTSSIRQIYFHEPATHHQFKPAASYLRSPPSSVVNVQKESYPQEHLRKTCAVIPSSDLSGSKIKFLAPTTRTAASQYPHAQHYKQQITKMTDVLLPHLKEQEKVQQKSSHGTLGVPVLSSKHRKNDPSTEGIDLQKSVPHH